MSVFTREYILKRLSEYFIKNRVENGIDHGARVAQPGGEVENPLADKPFAPPTDGRHQVKYEEGRPENDESEEYDAEHFGRFLFETQYAAVTR